MITFAALILMLSAATITTCYLIVLINMLLEGEILQSLFGLLCCQLWVFIWGWAHWESRLKGIVMTAWTIAFAIGLIAQLTIGTDNILLLQHRP